MRIRTTHFKYFEALCGVYVFVNMYKSFMLSTLTFQTDQTLGILTFVLILLFSCCLTIVHVKLWKVLFVVRSDDEWGHHSKLVTQVSSNNNIKKYSLRVLNTLFLLSGSVPTSNWKHKYGSHNYSALKNLNGWYFFCHI